MPENYNIELVAEIEDLIKRYNKKPDKDVKKKDIVTLLQKAAVLVPGQIGIKGCEMNDETMEGLEFKFDIVKDGGKVRLLPVFTSFEQIPQDYLDTFSFVKVNAATIFNNIEMCEDIKGMVINPFTEYNLEIKKKNNKKKSRTRGVSKAVDGENPQAMIAYDGKKYLVKKTPFTIGREGTNIEIPESYVSKIHVVISFKDGKYRIADYDSTNGTRLNGKDLKPKVYYEIRDGFEIELADKETLKIYID